MAFIFDAQKGQTPASVARQREIAAMLLGKTGYRSVNSVPEGIGAGLSALASGFGARIANKRADASEAEGMQGANSVYDQLMASLTGQGGSVEPTGSPMDYASSRVAQAHSNAGDPTAYRDAIASIESAGSGDYAAIGATHPELGRALGKYQVMEANIGPWTKEVLGQEMTPEQFLASPEAQDAVFDKQFGGYVDKFGSPEAAAQAWFGGPGGVGKTNRTDSLGTSVGEYGQKFSQAMGGDVPMPQPQQKGGLSVQQLMQAASNPWLNEGQRSAINMMLEQEMKRADPSNQLDMDYRRAQIGKIQRDAATGGESFFGNPVATQNEDGTVSYGQIGNKGTFRPIDLPEGQSFAPPTKRIDAGTEDVLVDQAGNVVARIPKNLSGAAADKAEGKAQGEAAASYRSMVSKMPGLEKVVTDLEKLADEATYTYGGQALDAAGRQLGMEPRDSAVARTKYISMVDNQILPLLRDTFGAQFTVKEGEALRATLGDPDKTPEEKKAVLSSFIEQKRRDVEALALQAMGDDAPALSAPAQTGGDWQDVGGVKIRRKQ